jgi:hypothetical protein
VRKLILLAPLPALLLTGCSTDSITRAKVEAAFAPTFTHLLQRQEQLLGGTPQSVQQLKVQSVCHKGPLGGSDKGAGEDWACVVSFDVGRVTPDIARYELEVKTDGCYRATGPTSVVGPLLLATPNGKTVANPLAEFDGCFDLG